MIGSTTSKVPTRLINSKKMRSINKENDDQHDNVSNNRNSLHDININCGMRLRIAAEKSTGHGDWELMRVKSLLQPLSQLTNRTVRGPDGTAAALPTIVPVSSIHTGVNSSAIASAGTAFEMYLFESTQSAYTWRGSKKRPKVKYENRYNSLLSDGNVIGKKLMPRGGAELAANFTLPLSQSKCGKSLTLPVTQILPLPSLRPYSAMNDDLGEENLGLSAYLCPKFGKHSTKTSQLVSGMDGGVNGSQLQTLTSLQIFRKSSLSFSLGDRNSAKKPKEVRYKDVRYLYTFSASMRTALISLCFNRLSPILLPVLCSTNSCFCLPSPQKTRLKKIERSMVQVPRKVDSIMILNLVPISSHYLPPVYPYTKPSYSPGDFRRQMVKSVRERDFFVGGIEGERSVCIESHRIVKNWDETEGGQRNENLGECIDSRNLLTSLIKGPSVDGGVHKITTPNQYAENIPVSCTNSLHGSMHSISERRRIRRREYESSGFKQEGQTHILGIQMRRGRCDEVDRMSNHQRDNGLLHLDLPDRKDNLSPLRDSVEDEETLRAGEGDKVEVVIDAEVEVEVEDGPRKIDSAGAAEKMKPVRRRSIINVDFYPDIDSDCDDDTNIYTYVDSLPDFDIGSYTSRMSQPLLEDGDES